jgi:hypothetical protein
MRDFPRRICRGFHERRSARLHRFADEKINQGAANSLIGLASEWEAERREAEQTVADIRESHADIDAGRVASITDTFAEIRKRVRNL